MADEHKDELISLVKTPMITAGLWPRTLSKNPRVNQLYSIYSKGARINYVYFYVSIVAELIRLIKNRNPLQVILSSFTVVVNATKISMKVIIYLKNNVLELCDDVVERERDLFIKNEPEIIELYREKIKIGKLFRLLLGVSTFLVVLGLDVAGKFL